jgi:thiol-disulfide isomerase/thioredoxin
MEKITRVHIIELILLITLANVHGQSASVNIGEDPPEFNFTIIDSSGIDTVNLDEFKNRAVILDFWATWCSPCIKSFPHLNELIDEYKNKPVSIFSITYEPENLIEEFLSTHKLHSMIATDNDFYMFREYNGWAIPTMILINSKGKFAGRIHPKNLTAKVIDKLIKGEIPGVEQVPEDLYDPDEAENYFRSLLKKNNSD